MPDELRRWHGDTEPRGFGPAVIDELLASAGPGLCDAPVVRRRLARMLLRDDRLEELIELVRPTEYVAGEADPMLLYHRAAAEHALGRFDDARRSARQSAELGYPKSLGVLALSLRALGRDDEALRTSRRALEHDPQDYSAATALSGILLESGRKHELWDVCAEAQSRGAWNVNAPSAMALAATGRRQRDRVRELVSPEIWFSTTQLDVDADFNADLCADLRMRMPNGPLPRRRATEGSGRRVDRLHAIEGSEVLTRFHDAIRGAVDVYESARLPLLAAAPEVEPMSARRPVQKSLDSWGITVRADGHEGWHMHPSGWLSGVYYAKVPVLDPKRQPRAGSIEFGPFPYALSEQRSTVWPGWTVSPEEGMLLLFPSHYPHRTWPTQVADDRVCIAFDILIDPEESSGASLVPTSVPDVDSTVVRSPRTLCAPAGPGKHILVDVDSGHCLVADDVAIDIWQLMDRPTSLAELTARICEVYDVPAATVRDDVRAALHSFNAHGMLRSPALLNQ